MKGRTIVDSFMQEPCQLSIRNREGYNKSKLLSAKGCDSIVQAEDERRRSGQTDLFPDELAFYKSLPEYNEAQ